MVANLHQREFDKFSDNTGSVLTQSNDQHNLEMGKTLTTMTNVTLPDNTPYYIKFNSSKNIHMIEHVINAITGTGNDLDYSLRVFEGGSDSGGTAEDVFFLHRDYASNNDVAFEVDVQGVDLTNATELPFGTRTVDVKRFSRREFSATEYVLKPNTNYYYELVNDSSSSDLEIAFRFTNEDY